MKSKFMVVKNENGWSLIEILISMAIMLILSMVAIPNYIAYKNKAYCVATVSDAHAIAIALADYFVVPSNTTASVTFTAAMPSARPYITIGRDSYYGYYPANTLVLSASTTDASVFQVGDSYHISVTEGAGNCPIKVRMSDFHWTQNPSGTPNSYFMTL